MPGLNKVMLIGHLGRDPETRWFEDGKAMCKLSLATSERYKDDQGQAHERTEWHQVVLWRDLARIADEHLKKGDRVYFEGRLRSRTWTDGDGAERRTTEVVADRMEMLGSPRRQEGDAESHRSSPAPMDGAKLPF